MLIGLVMLIVVAVASVIFGIIGTMRARGGEVGAYGHAPPAAIAAGIDME